GDRARDGEGQAQGRAGQVLRRRRQPKAQAAREAEGRQEADEAGRLDRGAAGGVPGRARDQPRGGGMTRHLYVHVPFCAHRCGYCDFVTVTGREDERARYVAALAAELERADVAPETVFVGGGTPSILADRDLARLLAALPQAAEVTVECNPETITPQKARVLVEGGVTRVSLGAQSFRAHLLDVLEPRARPEQIAEAVGILRAAGVQSLNLDLIFGVPGQREDDLRADLADLLALEPDHVSAYELEAK